MTGQFVAKAKRSDQFVIVAVTWKVYAKHSRVLSVQLNCGGDVRCF